MKHIRQTILEQLYDNGFSLMEDIVPTNPEYRPTCKKIGAEVDLIRDLMDEEGKRHFDHLMSLQEETGSMLRFANFAVGFRSGMLLMHEILSDKAD